MTDSTGIGLEGMLGLRTTGRTSKMLTADFARQVTDEDILSTQEERGTAPKPLKKLRQRHHALAKALADGVPAGEAGLLCGYTASHVSILQSDPSFKDLVKFYAASKREVYLDLHAKLASLGEDAVDELSERLEEAPEDISVGQLLEISKMSLDRSGHGPQSSTSVNVNVGLGDKLEAGRQRALAAKAQALKEARMIDITPEADDEH